MTDPEDVTRSDPGSRALQNVAANLPGKRVVLAVGGSIAAYKAVLVLRQLKQAGAEVKCILSRRARHFLGAQTLSALSGHAVHTRMFGADGGEIHVDLAAWADVIALAPATASTLARLAHGQATSLTEAVFLCTDKPVVIAPAMHDKMYRHSLTQENIGRLRQLPQVNFVGPVSGALADGSTGQGRMSEPEEIVAVIAHCCCPGDLAGHHLLITAGPTVEPIDPVRFLSNRSSGKMGFALAARARQRGARVTLIAGPVALEAPPGVRHVPVSSALDMQQAIHRETGSDFADLSALIMAAAVSDYRTPTARTEKWKRGTSGLSLSLTPNPDLLAELGRQRRDRGTRPERPLLVGFALETTTGQPLVEAARQKLLAKSVDLVVANSTAALEQDGCQASLVEATSEQPLPLLSKLELADRILDWVAGKLGTRPTSATANSDT